MQQSLAPSVLMRPNTQWSGNGERLDARRRLSCRVSRPSSCDRYDDEPNQPRDAEPGEQVADVGIDRVHSLHGDIGHHHLGIGGTVLADLRYGCSLGA